MSILEVSGALLQEALEVETYACSSLPSVHARFDFLLTF